MSSQTSSTSSLQDLPQYLVVDDDRTSLLLMERLLRSFGACALADSGQAAIAAFTLALDRGELFDLVTLDRTMPDLDGLEVLRHIRQEEERRDIAPEDRTVVIMVTASDDRDSVTACAEAGCNDYIIKPFDELLVDKTLKRWLS